MRSYFFAIGTLLCVLFYTPGLSAHHTSGHGGTMMSSFNPLNTSSRPPSTFLDTSFSVDRLDGGLGYVLRYELGLEYAFKKRFSLGARIPFVSVRENFLPNVDSVGDVGVNGKALIYSKPDSRLFVTLGDQLVLPTGSDEKGTGSGSTTNSLTVTVAQGYRSWQFFLTTGSTFALSTNPSPTIDYALGAIYPLSKSEFPVDFALTFEGSTSTASEIFESGATKSYLKPAILLHWSEKLATSIGARISVIDTLKVKSGVTLSQQSTAPLSDVLASFLFNMNYSF